MRLVFAVRLSAIALLCFLLAQGTSLAQEKLPAADAPPQVKAFVELLDDPGVRAWLKSQLAEPILAAADTATPAGADSDPEDTEDPFGAATLDRWRKHREQITAALPELPG